MSVVAGMLAAMEQSERDELARQAAYVLLDMVSAYDAMPIDSTDETAIKTAALRVAEADLIWINVDDEAGTRTLDINALLKAALHVNSLLLGQALIDRPNASGIDAIGAVRHAVDALWSDSTGTE